MSLMNEAVFAEKAAIVLERAQALGAQECSVQLYQSEGQSLQLREGQLEELNREQELSVGISVLKNQAMGHCSISDCTSDALCAAVQAAIDGATYTEADEYFGLPEAQYYRPLSAQALADLELDSGVLPSSDWLEAQAQIMESSAKAYDARIVLCDGAGADAGRSYVYLAQSNGFAGGYSSSHASLSLSVLAREQDDQQTDFSWDSARFYQDLQAPESIGRQAAQKAIAHLLPKAIASGEYPVIFDREIANGLLRHVVQALEGRAQYRKLSFLADSLGRQIMPEWLSLQEHPHLPRALSSIPFDSEGLAPADSALISEGRVARYLLNSYAARRLNSAPTGNGGGVHNLKLHSQAAPLPLEELYRQMGRGLIVTSLMGQGVDLLTGDYSRGASGFWVENGVISHAVEGLTIAGNLNEMLRDIVAIGDDADTRRSIHAPSIWIKKMVVAQ